jgi:molybdopterin synthase catalytic subunit
MKIHIHLGPEKIVPPGESSDPANGAVVCFSGTVRGEENGQPIRSLFYEAYRPMAENQIQAILKNLAGKYPCTSAEVIHRLGTVPVGETSLFVRVRAPHRSEAFQLLTSFLDRLKQDVPIWKTQP